jgi:hypothetical protein
MRLALALVGGEAIRSACSWQKIIKIGGSGRPSFARSKYVSNTCTRSWQVQLRETRVLILFFFLYYYWPPTC